MIASLWGPLFVDLRDFDEMGLKDAATGSASHF